MKVRAAPITLDELATADELKKHEDEATPLLYEEVTKLPIYTIRQRYTPTELIKAKLRFTEQVRMLFPPMRAERILNDSIVIKRIAHALSTHSNLTK